MKFEWKKYHLLANELYKNDTEEYIRSAISRDYYACFNLSKNYLIKKENILIIIHHKVIEKLVKLYNIPTMKKKKK